ncbi:hypothetical protein [Acinetobacter sp. MB5]|uniref:hypothetical protein n=1 Tax=Acinetobacter sp. MB5 TaxID=2069438 RepID=UPI000DCFAEDF|nr:hypothetical protein [Acinetobacter sp. MB5]
MNFVVKSVYVAGLLMLSAVQWVHAQSKTTWQTISKDKNIEIQLDRNSLVIPHGTMTIWAKNITKTQIIYMLYEVQCKPQKRFNIIAVNAKERKNNKDIPIRLAAKKMELHSAPRNSPAESVVNAVCGVGKNKAQ